MNKKTHCESATHDNVNLLFLWGIGEILLRIHSVYNNCLTWNTVDINPRALTSNQNRESHEEKQKQHVSNLQNNHKCHSIPNNHVSHTPPLSCEKCWHSSFKKVHLLDISGNLKMATKKPFVLWIRSNKLDKKLSNFIQSLRPANSTDVFKPFVYSAFLAKMVIRKRNREWERQRETREFKFPAGFESTENWWMNRIERFQTCWR